MAYFAKLDENNIVLQVVRVANSVIEVDGVENETAGVTFCVNTFGEEAGKTWKQTSYNASFRKNYAGKGYKYDADLDAFVAPQPFPSWTLNNETAQWEAPSAYPSNNDGYRWGEDAQTWVDSELLD